MSDSVPPHRHQTTRLPHPWDSPGKNTGVDCHFLLQWMKAKSESELAQSCPTLSNAMDCSPPGSSVHSFPGKSTGVGCHCLLRPGKLDGAIILDYSVLFRRVLNDNTCAFKRAWRWRCETASREEDNVWQRLE